MLCFFSNFRINFKTALRVFSAAHAWSFRRRLPEMSSCGCHPGKAGGLPMEIMGDKAAEVSAHYWEQGSAPGQAKVHPVDLGLTEPYLPNTPSPPSRY